MAAKPSTSTITIPELKIGMLDVTVVGTTPLIVHAWSKKAKLEMLGKQMQAPKGAKEAKAPWEDFQESLYRLPAGGYGFPSVAFKAAAVTAVTSIDGMTKVAARQAFHIVGEQIEVESAFRLDGAPLRARYDLVPILGSEPEMREDMVRVGMGTADLRYRGQFWPWYCNLKVVFNHGVLSEAQILNLINTAGFGVGIGEWRMERDGQNGSFRVATEADMRAMETGEEVSLAKAA